MSCVCACVHGRRPLIIGLQAAEPKRKRTAVDLAKEDEVTQVW